MPVKKAIFAEPFGKGLDRSVYHKLYLPFPETSAAFGFARVTFSSTPPILLRFSTEIFLLF